MAVAQKRRDLRALVGALGNCQVLSYQEHECGQLYRKKGKANAYRIGEDNAAKEQTCVEAVQSLSFLLPLSIDDGSVGRTRQVAFLANRLAPSLRKQSLPKEGVALHAMPVERLSLLHAG